MKKLPSPLLILGCGFVGTRLAQRALAEGAQVLATTRHHDRADSLRAIGVEVVATTPATIERDVISRCRAIIDSIPLERTEHGGWRAPQQDWVSDLVAAAPQLAWAGYLSSTSVYADSKGAWVDEEFPHLAQDGRGQQRLHAEQLWRDASAAVECFRLSGIYGPGRNLLNRLQQGSYRTVEWQPPRYANRIHVDDIVSTLMAAMATPKAGRVVNVSDDMPLPHAQYAKELARLIGSQPPQQLDEDEAKARCSADYLAFFQSNKRISNRRLHRELLPHLRYPSFRTALPSLLEQG